MFIFSDEYEIDQQTVQIDGEIVCCDGLWYIQSVLRWSLFMEMK
jgi:hypothetical protein